MSSVFDKHCIWYCSLNSLPPPQGVTTRLFVCGTPPSTSPPPSPPCRTRSVLWLSLPTDRS